MVNERPQKRFDTPKLKDYRKQLDTGLAQEEADAMALELLEDSAEVSRGVQCVLRLY